MRFGLFSFEKWAGRLSDFPGHFLGSGRVCRLVLRGFWGPELGEGRWGVTKPKRDILVAV
jgi:hypothetical protein